MPGPGHERFHRTVPFAYRSSHRSLRRLVAVAVLFPVVCSADPWLAPGDVLMRHDLEILADAGIVRGPLTSWPVPWPDVARDVLDDERTAELTGARRASLLRVQRAARRAMRTGEPQGQLRVGGTNQPDVLRGFAAAPREDGELGGAIGWMGERVALRLQATLVGDSDDGKQLRPDGSYVGVNFLNFMLSAGYVERWWGPGWDGSLILSTSSRPVPAITLERNYSDPFGVPVLEWLGPWRAGIVFGQLEDERADFDEARFFAARVTVKPWRHLEIGLSRSAQWCGEGRVCGFDAFSDLFLGRDNDQDPTQQPGNQLAGYDARLASPWTGIPLAVYGQLIGEDEAGSLPSKFLGLAGIEFWTEIGDSSLRATLEYADTSCAFSRSDPEFDCAYESSIYTAGYRFRGRSIGHAADGDSRSVALGALYVAADGTSWELKIRDAELNRDASLLEPGHTLAPLAIDLQSVDVRHQRELFGGWLQAGVGLERRDLVGTGAGDDEWRVMADWTGYF